MKNEPTYNLLNALNTPEDLRRLTPEQLPEVCDELRQDIIKEVSCNPGHFAASLGVVELTVALHYVLIHLMTASSGMWDIRLTDTKFSPDAATPSSPTGNWEASVPSHRPKRANMIRLLVGMPQTPFRLRWVWQWQP